MSNRAQLNYDKHPIVAIVVLVWNNYDDTRKCLESCYSQTYKNLMTILVDNGSTDGSGYRLSQEFPKADFIYNKENYGYGGGNNIGIKRALERGAGYVFVVNNDVVIKSKNLVEKLVSCFRKIPRLGILGPKVLDISNTDSYVKTSGVYDNIKRHFLPKINFDPPVDLDLSVRERVVVSGCAIMISRELLKKIGFFDEDFFMYGEEDTFCLRAAKAGFLILSVEDENAAVKHKGSTSYKDLTSWKAFLMARNRFIQLRVFSPYVQFIIVILHIFSLGKNGIKWAWVGKWKNIAYTFLGFAIGLNIWTKDVLKLSKPGEYLISGRNIASGGKILSNLSR